MKNERRNDKEHQRQRLQAYLQAQQVIRDLHHLAGNSSTSNITVGQMVSLAAGMGLCKRRRENVPPGGANVYHLGH